MQTIVGEGSGYVKYNSVEVAYWQPLDAAPPAPVAAVAQPAVPQKIMGFLVLSGLCNLGSFYHAHMREEADKHVASLANAIGGETARAVPLYAAAPSMAPVGTEREAFEAYYNHAFAGSAVDSKRRANCELLWNAACAWQAARTAQTGEA